MIWQSRRAEKRSAFRRGVGPAGPVVDGASLIHPTVRIWLVLLAVLVGAAGPPGPTISSNIHNAPGWRAGTAYAAAARVLSGPGWDPAGGTYAPGRPLQAYQLVSRGQCVSAQGGGPTGTGAAIADGSCVWKYLSTADYISITGWAFDNVPWQAASYRYRDYVTGDSPLRAYALESPEGCASTVAPAGTGQGAIVASGDGCRWRYFADIIYSSGRSHIPTMTFPSFPWSKTVRFTGATYNMKANHQALLWNDREYVSGENGELQPIRTQAHHDFTNDAEYGEADWVHCPAQCFHLIITPAPGESFRDQPPGQKLSGYDPAKGVAIRNRGPGRIGQGFMQRDNYVDFIGLQIKSDATSAIDGMNSHGNNTTIRHSILEGGPEAAAVLLDLGPVVMANSLVVSHGKTGFHSKYPAVILHSTIVNPDLVPGSVGIQTFWQWQYDGTVVFNTGVFGFEHAAAHLGTAPPFWSAKSAHNATDAAARGIAALRWGGQPYVDDPMPGLAVTVPSSRAFRSPGADWRLSPGSPLAGAGGLFGPFSVNCGNAVPRCPRLTGYVFDSPDIISTARPQAGRVDIGAWQTPN